MSTERNALDTIKPTTLEGIKGLAKQIKKRDGVTHTQALELAAKQAGYENFTHARKAFDKAQLGVAHEQ